MIDRGKNPWPTLCEKISYCYSVLWAAFIYCFKDIYRDRAEGGARGALAPPLFCQNKNKLNKKKFSFTHSSLAPHSKTCCAVPDLSSSKKNKENREGEKTSDTQTEVKTHQIIDIRSSSTGTAQREGLVTWCFNAKVSLIGGILTEISVNIMVTFSRCLCSWSRQWVWTNIVPRRTLRVTIN